MKKAAELSDIGYENAKAINKVFRKEGRHHRKQYKDFVRSVPKEPQEAVSKSSNDGEDASTVAPAVDEKVFSEKRAEETHQFDDNLPENSKSETNETKAVESHSETGEPLHDAKKAEATVEELQKSLLGKRSCEVTHSDA